MKSIAADNPVTNYQAVSPPRRVHVLFGLACVFVLTLFVTGYYQSSATIDSLATLRSQSRQLDAVDALLIDLLNAETGVRGYLITGNREYLDPYIDAVASLDTYLTNVDQSVDKYKHLDQDMQELQTLIERYKGLFRELIDTKQEGWSIDMADLYLGKVTFDQAREILARFKTHLSFDSSLFFEEAKHAQIYTRWAIFAICMAAFVFLLWLFSTLRKQAGLRQTIVSMLAHENENLDREVAKRTRQLNRLAAQLTHVSEAEKQRLARELHDDMGASLTAAKMDASWIAGRLAESADETLMSRSQRLIGSLDQAITLKRRLTTDLLPPLLAQLGLFEALRSLGEDLASHSETEVSIEIPETQPELDHPTSLALFRIAQEAFTNIRKYAQARHVSLKVTVTDERVFMEITDDGRGFDPAQVGEECFGLDSMRHRARMISANVGVRSAPGQGTAISVDYTLPGHRR